MTSFDDKARDWDKNEQRVERARVFADEILKQIPAATEIAAMEYGCGTGLLSLALQPRLAQITCADSSPGMLAVLREKIAAAGIRNLHPVELDLVRDPLPAQQFNLIFSLMVLHHVPDTAGILKSFHALLTSPGHLCIGDLDREDGSFHSSEFDGHKGFDREQLAAQYRAAGFQNVTSTIAFTMTKTRNEHKQDYPLFLLYAEKA